MIQDIRYAIRALLKSPGFAAAAVLTLALGIDANAAIFSVINAVLLRPLAFEKPDQLVTVYSRDPNGAQNLTTQPDLDDWRKMSRSFSGLASWAGQSVNLTGLEEPRRILGTFVSSNMFSTLGVTPAIGRGFAEGEDRLGGQQVAVLSDRLWHTQFAGDPKVIGKIAQFNGEPYTIVGIMPASFIFPQMDADVFLPAFKYPNYSMDRAQISCIVMGRLKDNSTVQTAQADMDSVAAQLAAAYPASNKGRGAIVTPVKETLVQNLRPSLEALGGAVAFVLLIVCANVASLLVGRMVSRSRERAVRIALGASRGRLMSHVAAETIVLGGVGGALGLLLAFKSIPAMAVAIADYLPNGAQVQLDNTVIAFTLGISLLSAVLIAVIPAWQGARSTSGATPLGSGRGAGTGSGKNRARNILVVAEIALALVLLAGAGLMIKSFSALGRAESGFDTHNLMQLAYRVPRNKYPTGAQQTQFHREVVEHILGVPGVLAATSVRAVPMGGNGNNTTFFRTDKPEPPVAEMPRALANFVDPNFFSTMRIPVLKGRAFSDRDVADGPPVMVINRTLALRYFGDRDPIGQHLRIPQTKQTGEIIGVVGDAKQFGLADPPTPQIYGSLAQNPFIFTSLAVRTAGDPMKLANEIRRAIWQVDRDQPVWSVHSYDEIIATQSRPQQLITGMLGAYAGLAVLLAAIGIFSIVSFAVTQRTGEIGVRMALGARPGDILRLIMRQGFSMALIGIAIGLGGAAWMSGLLKTQLYAVSPLDPAVYASVAVLLGGIALAACVIPARRAAKLNPVEALRAE
jgi:predicted permease